MEDQKEVKVSEEAIELSKSGDAALSKSGSINAEQSNSQGDQNEAKVSEDASRTSNSGDVSSDIDHGTACKFESQEAQNGENVSEEAIELSSSGDVILPIADFISAQ